MFQHVFVRCKIGTSSASVHFVAVDRFKTGKTYKLLPFGMTLFIKSDVVITNVLRLDVFVDFNIVEYFDRWRDAQRRCYGR